MQESLIHLAMSSTNTIILWALEHSIAQIVENGITYFLNFFSIPVKYVTIVLQAPFSCRKEDIL